MLLFVQSIFSWGSKKGATKDGLQLGNIRQVVFGARTPNFFTQKWDNDTSIQRATGLHPDEFSWRCFSIICASDTSAPRAYERSYDFVCTDPDSEDDALMCVFVLQRLSPSLVAGACVHSWSRLKVKKVALKIQRAVESGKARTFAEGVVAGLHNVPSHPQRYEPVPGHAGVS